MNAGNFKQCHYIVLPLYAVAYLSEILVVLCIKLYKAIFYSI